MKLNEKLLYYQGEVSNLKSSLPPNLGVIYSDIIIIILIHNGK